MIKQAVDKTLEVINYQKSLVRYFETNKKKDFLYWFCKAYLIVTQKHLKNICEKKYSNPLFVANVIVKFNAVFEENLDAFLHHKPIPSKEWESVFIKLSTYNQYWLVPEFISSWKILSSCVDVHIQTDLPICLAAVMNEKSNDSVDVNLLEKDFFAMVNIFHYTAEQIEIEMMDAYKLPMRKIPSSIRNFFLKKYIHSKIISNRAYSWQLAKMYCTN